MADAALLAANFALGVAAFFSPCGFPMLPAYVAYYLPRAGAAPASRARDLARGLAGGLLAALGALLVLGAVGALAVTLGAPFKQRVVWLELVGGLVVLALGILVLSGRGPKVALPVRAGGARGAWGILAFGALYAAVAASCVAPVFLGVLVGALAAPSTADAALQLAAYAAGLATLLLVVTVLIALAQDAAVRALKRALPHAERASGAVLVLVGLYLLAYWARVQGLGI